MDNGEVEIQTNYDDLMVAGNGVVPGERSVVVVSNVESTPVRPVQARTDGGPGVMEIREVIQGERDVGSVEMLNNLLQQMVQQQANTMENNQKTMEASQKTMEQNIKCIQSLSSVLTEKTKGEKRSREESSDEKLKGDEPIMVDFKTLEMDSGRDDAHNSICWEIRRCWRMINMDPKEVWRKAGEGKGWPLKVEPNLAGNVFLEHLVPSLVGDKALSWLHDGSRTPEMRSFLHSNSRARSKKSQRTEVMARHTDDGEGGMTIDTFVTWAEAGSMKEIVESVYNYTAALYMVRPWDYSGLVMLRCLHDVAYFAITSRTAKEQRDLALEFVEEAFMVNSRQLTKGQHPITLKEAMELASAKVAGKNGLAHNINAQCDVYGLHREVREKEAEVKKLKDEVARLKKQLQEEKTRNSKKTYGEYVARRNGRPLEGDDSSKEGRRVRPSEAFYEARKKTCIHFNKGDCREGDSCTRGDHLCSAQVGTKMCGSSAHCRAKHV